MHASHRLETYYPVREFISQRPKLDSVQGDLQHTRDSMHLEVLDIITSKAFDKIRQRQASESYQYLSEGRSYPPDQIPHKKKRPWGAFTLPVFRDPGITELSRKNGACHSHQVATTKYQYRARGKSYNLRSNVVRILRFLIRLVDIQIFIPNLRSNIVRILTLNHMHGKLFSICHSTDVALHSKRLRLLVLGPSAEKFCRHSSPCGEEYQHCTDLSQW